MKRFLCVMLIVCILPFCALADYSAMSDDELKAEFKSIVTELLSRGIWESDILPAGVYIVGVSLPVGAYELTPSKRGTIEMYPDAESFKIEKNRFVFDILQENEPYVVTLIEGVCVNIECTCAIKPLAFSW